MIERRTKIIIEGINRYMGLEWVHCRLNYCQKRKKTFGIEKNITNKNIKLTKMETIIPINDHHLRNGQMRDIDPQTSMLY